MIIPWIFEKGIEVTVIDNSDKAGRISSRTRIGDIYMDSVQTMVENVKKKVGGRKISRLNILDHGTKESIEIGNDVINEKTLFGYQHELAELKKHFDDKAIVHLRHCLIGQNSKLLLALAKIFGVPVYAGTGLQDALLRYNQGVYVRADPDGCFKVNTGRPKISEHHCQY